MNKLYYDGYVTYKIYTCGRTKVSDNLIKYKFNLITATEFGFLQLWAT